MTHPQFTNGRFESSRIWTNAFWWFNEWFEKKRIKRINNSKKIKINPIQLKMCITEYKRKSFRESAKKGNFLLRFLSWSFCYNKSHDIHIILFNSWFCGQISPILSSKQVQCVTIEFRQGPIYVVNSQLSRPPTRYKSSTSIYYDHFKLLLWDTLTKWSTLFVNVHRKKCVRIPIPAVKRPLV